MNFILRLAGALAFIGLGILVLGVCADLTLQGGASAGELVALAGLTIVVVCASGGAAYIFLTWRD